MSGRSLTHMIATSHGVSNQVAPPPKHKLMYEYACGQVNGSDRGLEDSTSGSCRLCQRRLDNTKTHVCTGRQNIAGTATHGTTRQPRTPTDQGHPNQNRPDQAGHAAWQGHEEPRARPGHETCVRSRRSLGRKARGVISGSRSWALLRRLGRTSGCLELFASVVSAS